MKDVQDLSGDELLDELGIELVEELTGGYTARQERIIAGFEDILRFYETKGQPPLNPIMNRDTVFNQTAQVAVDQLMVFDRIRRSAKVRGQITEVRVIGGRIHRHPCAFKQNEVTPLPCVDYYLRQVHVLKMHLGSHETILRKSRGS